MGPGAASVGAEMRLKAPKGGEYPKFCTACNGAYNHLLDACPHCTKKRGHPPLEVGKIAKRKAFAITDEQYLAIAELARRLSKEQGLHVSFSAVVRMALEEYLKTR